MPNGELEEQFKRQLEEWEKQAGLYAEEATKQQEQLTQLSTQLQELTPEPEHPIKSLVRVLTLGLGERPPTPPPAREIKAVRTQIDAIMINLKRSNFYYKVYYEVPYVISGGKANTVDDILSRLDIPPNLTATELAEVEGVISGMINTITGRPSLPEMAAEAEIPELPELVVPIKVTVPPTTISRITIEAILKSLTAPRVPPPTMTNEQWTELLKMEGYSDADLEQVQFMEDEADRVLAGWEEDRNRFATYEEAFAEMPDYTLGDFFKELVIQPGLGVLELARVYFEHVSQPLAGAIYKTFIPDIEAEYQRLRKTESTWMALSHAWREWDSNWFLKYMIMENLVDPLTYVGWGIASRIVKPVPYIGRFVGIVERGIQEILEVPFDLIKAGWRALPTTIGQRALVAQHIAGQKVTRFMEKFTGKYFNQITMKDWDEAADAALKFLKTHPQSEELAADAARQLLKHSPVDDTIVRGWATRLGTVFGDDDFTRVTLESVENLFEDTFTKKLITPKEASGRLLRILGVEDMSDDGLKLAQRLIEQRAGGIVNTAKIFSRFKTPYQAMRSLMRRNYKLHVITEESAAALARKESIRFSALLADTSIRLQGVWKNTIDRYVVRPFAEAYLTFGMYGPMNVLEDYGRSILGGVFPQRMNVEGWERISWGLATDPELKRFGLSEMLGPLAREGSEEGWNNWILQLATLGKRKWADKLYAGMVRIPGGWGMDVRRNFIARRYIQLLRETGGETAEKLLRAGPKAPKLANKQLVKQLESEVYRMKLTGNPDLIRGAKDLFTRQKIVKQEVRNILMEHPNLPNSARDFILKQYDDRVLFHQVTPRSIRWEKIRFTDLPEEQITRIKSLMDDLPLEFKTNVKEIEFVPGAKVSAYDPWDARIELAPKWDEGTVLHEFAHDIIERSVKEHDVAFFRELLDAASGETLFGPTLVDYQAAIRSGQLGYKQLRNLHEEFATDFRLYIQEPANLARFPKLTKFYEKHFPKIGRPEDSINMALRDANSMIVDDFIRGPEYATKQFQQLADLLTQMEVRNPQEMARCIQAVNKMSELYGTTPRQIMAQATIRNRGLPLVDRRASFDRTFDDIYAFMDRAGADIDSVWARLEVQMKAGITFSDDYTKATSRLHDLMTTKRQYASEFRAQDMAIRRDVFATATQKELKTNTFWDDFYSQVDNQYLIFDTRVAEIDGMIATAIESVDLAAGIKPFARPAIKVVDRPLSPQDVANLVGARGDDISRALMDVLTAQNSKPQFTAYVLAKVRPGDEGFTKEAIGAVYDQIAHSLGVKPEAMSWITGKQMELDAVRRDLHGLYNSKLLPDEEILSIGRFIDDTADAVQDLMYTARPGRGRMTRKTSWDLSEITVGSREVEEASTAWVRRGDRASLNKLVSLVRGDARYKSKMLSILREQYGDTITVYRGGVARKGIISVSPDEAQAAKFGKVEQFTIKTSDVMAVGPTAEQELLVSSTKLRPAVPAKPPVLKPAFKDYDSIRQSSMDEAHKWYYKEYTDYSNANAFDSIMKTIYPYWTYESQRFFWLPRSFVRHPGTFTAFERWQNNSDYGYIHIPGTSVDINPFRGTIYGTLTTRLTRRDFPEYYDALPVAGGYVEFMDFLSRYGFYPGAHLGIPLAMFGGLEQQMGETIPALWKTPLNALIAALPESESVKFISDRIFSDRFRDYMTILMVNKRGLNGTFIWTKIKEGLDLTEEEQATWDDSRREAALYGMGFEQFGLFRLRSDEQHQIYEESSKVIEEMTGYTLDQQDWLRKHGYRIWDLVGGMSPTQQGILQEMDYYRWVGMVRPMLPSQQQVILNRLELDWDDVRRYTEGSQKEKMELQQMFLNGTIGPDAYNAKLIDLYDDQRNYIDTKMEENPLMTLEGRAEYYKKYGIVQPVLHPMRELLNLYFSVELQDKIDEETGELFRDWDTFWAMREAIEDAVPENLKGEWEDYLARNSTRIEELRREVYYQYFRPYNRIWEQVLTGYPEPEQKLIKEYLSLERRGMDLARQAEIKAMTSEKTGNLLVSSFRTDVSSSRIALRYANPNLDAWLFYWGRVTSFQTPEAETIYQQIARDTGRRL